MSVGVVRRGVIAFVLHKSGFEGRCCGFMLVHEPFGFSMAHSHVVYPDAAVVGVVFDDHDCFFPVGCYSEVMGFIEINGDSEMRVINTDYIVSMSKDRYSVHYTLVLATPDGRYSARICLSDSDYQKVLNELRRKAPDGELPA